MFGIHRTWNSGHYYSFGRQQAFERTRYIKIRQPLRSSVLVGHIFRRQHLRILRLALHTSLARWHATFMRSVVAQFSCMSLKAIGVVSACQPQLSRQPARSKGCYVEQRKSSALESSSTFRALPVVDPYSNRSYYYWHPFGTRKISTYLAQHSSYGPVGCAHYASCG